MHEIQVAFERGKDFMKSFFEIIVRYSYCLPHRIVVDAVFPMYVTDLDYLDLCSRYCPLCELWYL